MHRFRCQHTSPFGRVERGRARRILSDCLHWWREGGHTRRNLVAGGRVILGEAGKPLVNCPTVIRSAVVLLVVPTYTTAQRLAFRDSVQSFVVTNRYYSAFVSKQTENCTPSLIACAVVRRFGRQTHVRVSVIATQSAPPTSLPPNSRYRRLRLLCPRGLQGTSPVAEAGSALSAPLSSRTALMSMSRLRFLSTEPQLNHLNKVGFAGGDMEFRRETITSLSVGPPMICGRSCPEGRWGP